MLTFIQNSSRISEPKHLQHEQQLIPEAPIASNKLLDNGGMEEIQATRNWRQLAADLRLYNKARMVPANFLRDLRHLDSTQSREAHKVAVIYVSRDQEVIIPLR